MTRNTCLLLCLLAACGDGERDDTAAAIELPACVEDHPMGDPESDLAVDLGVGVDEVVALCEEAGGEACPTTEWNVGRSAALCIAQERGFEPAVHEVSAYLIYDVEVDRPCWEVDWTWDTEDYQFGVLLIVDVLEGSIVDEDAWNKSHDEEPC